MLPIWLLAKHAQYCVFDLALMRSAAHIEHVKKSSGAQVAAIERIERDGYNLVCWFDTHDGGQCAIMSKRSQYLGFSCRVDPDGSVNGISVEDFIEKHSMEGQK